MILTTNTLRLDMLISEQCTDLSDGEMGRAQTQWSTLPKCGRRQLNYLYTWTQHRMPQLLYLLTAARIATRNRPAGWSNAPSIPIDTRGTCISKLYGLRVTILPRITIDQHDLERQLIEGPTWSRFVSPCLLHSVLVLHRLSGQLQRACHELYQEMHMHGLRRIA